MGRNREPILKPIEGKCSWCQIDAENDNINVSYQLKNQIDAKLRDNQAKRADYTTQGVARQVSCSRRPTTDNLGVCVRFWSKLFKDKSS